MRRKDAHEQLAHTSFSACMAFVKPSPAMRHVSQSSQNVSMYSARMENFWRIFAGFGVNGEKGRMKNEEFGKNGREGRISRKILLGFGANRRGWAELNLSRIWKLARLKGIGEIRSQRVKRWIWQY